jgi:hypothetical protein
MKKRILLLTALLSMGLAAVAQVPNPYTYFDVPTDPYEVPVGLPKNDEGDQPPLQKPRPTVSYCAYRIGPEGYPTKIFYDATSKRQYSVASGINPATGEEEIIKTLTIPDSLALYRINDKAKTITKLPAEAMKAVGSVDVTDRKDDVTEEDMVSNSDRWCYMKTVVTKEKFEGPYGTNEDEHYRTTYTDPETGITLCEDADGIETFIRNIHLGVPYPEVFELPKDYTFIVQDFSSGLDAYKEMEDKMKKVYEKLGNMGNSGSKEASSSSDKGAEALKDLLNKFKTK